MDTSDLNRLYAQLINSGYTENEAIKIISQGNMIPYVSPAATSTASSAANAGASAVGNAGLLAGLRNKFGSGKSLFSGSLPNLKGLGKDIRNTQLWDGGPKVSTAANTLSGIYQGGKAIKGLYENSTKDSDYDDLKKDIALQIASNPMYDMYMDASDEKLLRQMNNGTLTDNWSSAMSEGVKGIPQAAGAALLGGVTGGLPGALIGGLGSLANSGISGYGKGTEEANAKLQGLYSRLKQADEEYRTMKRPSGLRRAGLSTQYFNQLY